MKRRACGERKRAQKKRAFCAFSAHALFLIGRARHFASSEVPAIFRRLKGENRTIAHSVRVKAAHALRASRWAQGAWEGALGWGVSGSEHPAPGLN